MSCRYHRNWCWPHTSVARRCYRHIYCTDKSCKASPQAEPRPQLVQQQESNLKPSHTKSKGSTSLSQMKPCWSIKNIILQAQIELLQMRLTQVKEHASNERLSKLNVIKQLKCKPIFPLHLHLGPCRATRFHALWQRTVVHINPPLIHLKLQT